MRKIYVVGGGWGYARWMEGRPVDNMREADLVVFTGGEDINPEIYGKKAHPSTYFNTRRDKYELDALAAAKEMKKPIVGICRGAQLLCAAVGGILVQNQRHPWIHPMKTEHGEILTNSMHHQRAYPWGDKHLKFELLGWADPGYSPFSQGEGWKDNMDDGRPEAEVVLYPEIKALAIQGHPEMAFPVEHQWEKNFINFCRLQLDRTMEL